MAEIQNSNPHFFVTKSKNRLKVYNNKEVYLENGQEFELELFNPTQTKVLAKIYLNGKLISSSGLVLKPGERYYLDRFIDQKEKFKFSTYEVDGSNEQVKKAIANNGLIEVEFYDEYVPLPKINDYWTSNNIWINHTGGYQYNNGTLNIGSGVIPLTFDTTTVSTNTARLTNYSHVVGDTNYNAGTITTTASININKNIEIDGSKLETGMIEKGSESQQTFGTDYGSYNSIYSTKLSYQILPVSQKAIESKDIRCYCTECGSRNRQNWKFCPKCGTKY